MRRTQDRAPAPPGERFGYRRRLATLRHWSAEWDRAVGPRLAPVKWWFLFFGLLSLIAAARWPPSDVVWLMRHWQSGGMYAPGHPDEEGLTVLPAAIRTTSRALCEEFRADPDRAWLRYANENMSVTGAIACTGKDVNVPYIVLRGTRVRGVQCRFSHAAMPQDVRFGSQITILGRCRGMAVDPFGIYVVLGDCAVEGP